MAFDYNAVTAGIRDSVRESFLASLPQKTQLAAANIAKIGSNPGPIDTAFSWNLQGVGRKLVDGKCNIMFVGDSINNPTQVPYMRGGYIDSWTPTYWRGLDAALSSGASAVNGFMVTAPPAAVTTIVASAEETNSFSHTNPNIDPAFAGHQVKVNAGTSGFRELIIQDSLNEGNADYDINYRIIDINPIDTQYEAWFVGTSQTSSDAAYNNANFKISVMLYAPQETRVVTHARGRGAAGYTDKVWDLKVGYNIVELDCGAVNPAGTKYSQYISWSGKAGDKLGILSVKTEITGIEEGIYLSYTGGGGWGVHNHATGDVNQLPTVGGSTAGAGYSDEGMTNHLRFHNIDTVAFWIGNNDTYAEVEEYYADMLKRYDSLCDSSTDFILVAPYASSADQGRWDDQSTLLKRLAQTWDGRCRVSFLDMNALVNNAYGAYGVWQPVLLSDAVHPNATGADAFAQLFIDEVALAVATEDIGPALTYTVTTDEEYAKLMSAVTRLRDK